ncbi:adenine phosphoribosyltransferase [bacterium]|nr:adenine phosphoribosyltransferase [bacterium]
MQLEKYVRNVQDFPKPGIGFKDITTLLKDGPAFRVAIDEMADSIAGIQVDAIIGVEARGFVFAAALAYKLGIGFIPVRKPGKLPAATIQETYSLEYGTDSLEMHKDALTPGMNVLIVDDLLATGGTISATVRLTEKLGAKVAALLFLIELDFLRGREKLSSHKVISLIHYDSE